MEIGGLADLFAKANELSTFFSGKVIKETGQSTDFLNMLLEISRADKGINSDKESSRNIGNMLGEEEKDFSNNVKVKALSALGQEIYHIIDYLLLLLCLQKVQSVPQEQLSVSNQKEQVSGQLKLIQNEPFLLQNIMSPYKKIEFNNESMLFSQLLKYGTDKSELTCNNWMLFLTKAGLLDYETSEVGNNSGLTQLFQKNAEQSSLHRLNSTEVANKVCSLVIEEVPRDNSCESKSSLHVQDLIVDGSLDKMSKLLQKVLLDENNLRDEKIFSQVTDNSKRLNDLFLLMSAHNAFSEGSLRSAVNDQAGTVSQDITKLVELIVEKGNLFLGKDLSVLKLKLKPEYLGNLDLLIKVKDGGVYAHFLAENAVVANLIEMRLPELRQSLEQQGIFWQQIRARLRS